MNGLNDASFSSLSNKLIKPNYDRTQVDVGIVHLGPGAFHRAHQAYFTDKALEQGGHWGICGVSLNSPSVKNALSPQDGLYTLAIQEQQNQYQLIGALKEVLYLEQDRSKVMQRLLSESTKIVTLTITEKGYCTNGNGVLDLTNSAIKHDIAYPDNPSSAIGLLVNAISARRQQCIQPLLVISCDNVTENGRKLQSAIMQFCQAINNDDLAAYIQDHVEFPCTMVDSITPATDDDLRENIVDELGYHDAWPIKREAFAQWVIETISATDLPAWDKAGVVFTPDIEAFENAKLRLLNLPHSSLAYMGTLLGLVTVSDAMKHVKLKNFVCDLVNQEVIPSIAAPDGLNLQNYRDEILNRFRNPSIHHHLEQIAQDGSQKLQMRLIPIIKANLQEGRSINKLCIVLASWFKFIINKIEQGDSLVDPIESTLKEVVTNNVDDLPSMLEGFLSIGTLFEDDIYNNRQFNLAIKEAYTNVMTKGVAVTIN